MKKTAILLLAAVLLVWTAPLNSQARQTEKISAADANRLFEKMYGTHQVRTLIWQPEQQHFFESTGNVRYSVNKNKTLHEEFNIVQPDGSSLHLEGMLRYCEEKGSFEFVQYDEAGNAVIMMEGMWDPSFSMIQLSPIKRQWQLNGRKRKPIHEVYLQYMFFDDGFRKVLWSTENTGDSGIVYQYHCFKPNLANR